MELPPLQRQVLASLATANGSREFDVRAALEKLPAGTTLQAVVESVQPLTDKARTQLAQYIEAQARSSLAQKLAPPLPATKAEAQLDSPSQGQSHLSRLATAPELFAVHLKVLGKSVMTLAEVAPPLKQMLSVITRTDGQLQLLSLKPTHVEASAANTTAAKLNLALAATTGSGTPATAQLPVRDPIASMATLMAGLRQYLPQQGNVATTFDAMQALLNGVNKPAPAAQALLQVLASVLERAPTPHSLSQPDALKQVLQNAGGTLENKLRMLESTPSTAAAAQTATPKSPSTPGAVVDRAAQAPAAALLNRTSGNPSSAAGSPATGTATLLKGTTAPLPPEGMVTVGMVTKTAGHPEPTLQQDLKAELLRLVALLSGLAPAPESRAGAAKPAAHLNSAIDKLLQNLFMPSDGGKKPTSHAHAQGQLASTLRSSILGSLARISVLQLRHLTQATQEGASALGAFVELPVKVAEQFYPLVIHIQEREGRHSDKEPEKNAHEERTKHQLKKNWHVFMEFDLDEFGTFASEIDLCGNQVKTRLWVEKADLWQLTQDHLVDLKSALEANGIEVEELQCHQGKAPDKEMKIQQHLVDVRT